MKPTNEPAKHTHLIHFAWGAVAIGIVMIVASFLVPTRAASRALWTPEKAERYQQAAIRVHELSHVDGDGATDNDTAKKHADKLAAALAKYDEIRSELDAATNRPLQLVTLLRWGGVAAALSGTLLYYALLNRS